MVRPASFLQSRLIQTCVAAIVVALSTRSGCLAQGHRPSHASGPTAGQILDAAGYARPGGLNGGNFGTPVCRGGFGSGFHGPLASGCFQPSFIGYGYPYGGGYGVGYSSIPFASGSSYWYSGSPWAFRSGLTPFQSSYLQSSFSTSTTFSSGFLFPSTSYTYRRQACHFPGLFVCGMSCGPSWGLTRLSLGYGTWASPYSFGSPMILSQAPWGWTIDPWTGLLIPLSPWTTLPPVPWYSGVHSVSIPVPAAQDPLAVAGWSLQPGTDTAFLTDPRMLDQLAPAPVVADAVPAGLRPLDVDDGAPPNAAGPMPLLNEFPTEHEVVPESSALNRLQSLMHQMTGDTAFRNQDYAAAIASYEQAFHLAPERRSPRMRLAMAGIAVGNYPLAAERLKSCLLLPPEPTTVWITAEQLYGPDFAPRALAHVQPLSEWLSERPLSADRLLLTGAFQILRGQEETGRELLEFARHEGQESDLVDELVRLSSAPQSTSGPDKPDILESDPGPVPPPPQPVTVGFLDQPVSSGPNDARGNAAPAGTEGIFLQGRQRQAER